MPKEKRQFYIDRLYAALVELQLRFHDDWINGRIDKDKVMIVKYDRMMLNFEDLMGEILVFVDHDASKELLDDLNQTHRTIYKTQLACVTMAAAAPHRERSRT